MPRKIDDVDDLPASQSRLWPAHEVSFKTITWTFGGSAAARMVDPSRPFREPSIKGHLRYWWRAWRAGEFATIAELRTEEARVWGASNGGSPLAVQVVQSHGERGQPIVVKDGHSRFEECPQYAAWPFDQDARGNRPPAAAIKAGATCTLRIRASDQLWEDHIAPAIALWIHFGGIGARTRRGCGSLVQTGGDSLQLPLRLGEADSGPPLVTRLPTAYLVGPPSGMNAGRAWVGAVEAYRTFRQGVGTGRNPAPIGATNPQRLGQSLWPEADSIRDHTRAYAPGHVPAHPARSAYPRADLGLPIVFHFQNRDRSKALYNPPEPGDTILEGDQSGRARFASPVITKPIWDANQNCYRPMVAILDAPHVWQGPGVRLGGTHVPDADVNLTPPRRALTAPLGGRPIREALETHVRGRNYGRVTL